LTSSVGELKSIEIHIASGLFGHEEEAIRAAPLATWVTPRDARSASLSYDGRETPGELRFLTTLPLAGGDDTAFGPVWLARPWPDRSLRYVEMAHPHDVSRRILKSPGRLQPVLGSELSVRHGLFGHDLEKGVIVRGRLRGLWVSTESSEKLIGQAYQRFLDLPPPLGT